MPANHSPRNGDPHRDPRSPWGAVGSVIVSLVVIAIVVAMLWFAWPERRDDAGVGAAAWRATALESAETRVTQLLSTSG